MGCVSVEEKRHLFKSHCVFCWADVCLQWGGGAEEESVWAGGGAVWGWEQACGEGNRWQQPFYCYSHSAECCHLQTRSTEPEESRWHGRQTQWVPHTRTLYTQHHIDQKASKIWHRCEFDCVSLFFFSSLSSERSQRLEELLRCSEGNDLVSSKGTTFCPLLCCHNNTCSVAIVVGTICCLFVLIFPCLERDQAGGET